MISGFDEITKIFEEIDEVIDKPVDAYLIGGGALLFYDFGKGFTKDVDLIFTDKDSYGLFKSGLEECKFKTRQVPKSHSNMEISEMLQREPYRFDLFVDKVCGDFRISEKMIARSKMIIELDKIRCMVLSLEDIMLFKSLTDRENDVEDSVEIIKRGIDWDVVLDEYKHQIGLCGDVEEKKRLSWYFLSRMKTLMERFDIDVPIFDKAEEFRDGLFD